MYCPKCGKQNDDNNFKCIQCDNVLHPVLQTNPVTINNDLGGLIPYKNKHALIAYYLAVFSLIPFLGIILGITAFILGIIGLKKAN